MSIWERIPFSDLLVESRDGEWGEGQAKVGHQLCEMIRGTDFANLNDQSIDLPRRWIPDHLVERKRLRAGDIIFEMAGGTAKQSTGRSAILNDRFFERHKDNPVLCASFCRHLRLDIGRFSPQFIYFMLQALYDAGYMSVYNIQHTGVSRFQYTSFKKMTILDIPSLVEQKKIAAILSAYDDLIENNQRRIALLEKMAEELYREWFVRLRFPGHDQTKMEKGVPKTWQLIELGKLCKLIKRGIAPNYVESSDNLIINQRCIRNGVVYLAEARGHESNAPEEKLIKFGDVLINSTGVGTLGRVAVFDHERTDLTCDTHVTICRPDTSAIGISYFWCVLRTLQSYFENMAVGSTGQAELGRNLIAKTKILKPSKDVQELFARIAEPLWREKRLLNRQLLELTKARDLLLPRLISGKLSVESLAIHFPPSMQEPVHAS